MRRPSGFTLIELVVAIVIIAAAGGTLIALLASMSKASAENLIQTQCNNIANAYLNEILAQPFQDPDVPEAGRANFDNVNDYGGLVDAGAADRYGNAIAGLSDFTVSVDVSSPGLHTIAGVNTRLIQVRVSHSSGVVVLLSGFKTAHP